MNDTSWIICCETVKIICMLGKFDNVFCQQSFWHKDCYEIGVQLYDEKTEDLKDKVCYINKNETDIYKIIEISEFLLDFK